MVTIAEQQQEEMIAPKPATVSSTSSIDTAVCADLSETLCNEQSSSESPIQQSSSLPLEALNNSALASTGSNQSIDTSVMYHPSLPTATANIGNVSLQPLQPPNIALRSTLSLSPSSGLMVPSVPTTNTVPEFLYQLTKMLTDNNRDIIEWSNGKIEVHSPHKLESQVLNRYFRHSKFASFQRQLNYFGFRKLAGKGKMAPCSYVNDSTTDALGSLLLVKRKQGNEPKSIPGGKKRDRDDDKGENSNADDGVNSTQKSSSPSVNPILAGILYRSASSDNTASLSNSSPQQSQKALARVAVGRGIRHGFVPQQQQSVPTICRTGVASAPQVVAPSPVQASLNALTHNFKNSLQGLQSSEEVASGSGDQSLSGSINSQNGLYLGGQPNLSEPNIGFIPGSLRRDDSLVDLAMIPIAEDGLEAAQGVCSNGFSFVDFPFDSTFFSNEELADEAPQD